MKPQKITFEEKFSKKKRGQYYYQQCELLLKINDSYFDPDIKNKHTKTILENIHNKYWNRIRHFYLDGHRIIVKISELKPVEIGRLAETYRFYKDVHRNIITHFHSWKTKDGGWAEEGYVLIDCDKQLFKVLFDRYWFCLADEIQFEGYVVKPEDSIKIEKWNRQNEGPNKFRALMKLSSFVFDNNRNGFHYSVTTTKKA